MEALVVVRVKLDKVGGRVTRSRKANVTEKSVGRKVKKASAKRVTMQINGAMSRLKSRHRTSWQRALLVGPPSSPK